MVGEKRLIMGQKPQKTGDKVMKVEAVLGLESSYYIMLDFGCLSANS